MKRMGVVLAVWALLVGVVVLPSVAATPEQIWAAVENGVAWLVTQQRADGSWGNDWNYVAVTGFALVKLCEFAYESGTTPFNRNYKYAEKVLAGFDYIFSHAAKDGLLVSFPRSPWDSRDAYGTGIVMMAIASSGEPDRLVTTAGSAVSGQTFKQVVQGCVDAIALGQNVDGGWGYHAYPANQSRSDNSNTGYVVLGLRYAETFGCTVPATLKAKLSSFVDLVQDDVSGGSWYVPSEWAWVNLLKTGNLLFEMAFVGDDASSARAQAAIGYIQNHWNDNSLDPGWRACWQGPPPPPQAASEPVRTAQNVVCSVHFQATYCLMKGFDSLGIQTITVDGSPVDWFQEFADAILAVQNADGSWPSDYWGDEVLGTIWALLTIERVAPPLRVSIDVKPGSFPNSINPGDRGTIPVAIFSTPTFDAPARIDPRSLTFGRTGDEKSLAYRGRGVPNVGVEDVNGDGLPDLVVHFTTQLTGFQVGDTEGILRGETHDGLKFEGRDSVRIVPPARPKDLGLAETGLVFQVLATPNPVTQGLAAVFTVTGAQADLVQALRVQVFDMGGRLVFQGEDAGTRLVWSTSDRGGLPVASGVYLYTVQFYALGQWTSTRVEKLLILR